MSVKGGGVLSSTHYKRYKNPLLLQLEDKYTGMQHMLDDTGEFANMERYMIHPTKSGVLTYTLMAKL